MVITTAVTTDEEEYDELNLPSEEETLLARIPLMAGSNRKAAYLSFRAVGFTIAKAAELAGVTRPTIRNWRMNDPVFKRWEEEELERLQSTVGNDVIKFDFLRNMKLLLHQDMTVVSKALLGLEKLTEREYEVYKSIRRFYTPAEWLAIEKVLAPEKHNSSTPITITLNWGNRLNPTDSDMQIEGQARDLTDDPADTEPDTALLAM